MTTKKFKGQEPVNYFEQKNLNERYMKNFARVMVILYVFIIAFTIGTVVGMLLS